MSGFLEGLIEVIVGIFEAITQAFASFGNMLFTFTEGSALPTGVQPLGYVLLIVIGLPVVLWLFNLGWKALTSIGRRR